MPLSNETGQSVENRDVTKTILAVKKRDEMERDPPLDEFDHARLYQIGDGRAPENTGEDAALARWVEVDERRYFARLTGKPFHLTPAERALRYRLLKAGLITKKHHPKPNRRRVRARNLQIAIAVAKRYAAEGHPVAIENLRHLAYTREQAAWQRKWRQLQKSPIDHLLLAAQERATPRQMQDALDAVMERTGTWRSLTSLWREFFEAWKAASEEKRQEIIDEVCDLPAIMDTRLRNS